MTPTPTTRLSPRRCGSISSGTKEWGPALGPAAGPAAERAFRVAGYHTWLRPSPWRLGAADGSLARALNRRVGGSCFGAAPRGRAAHPGLGGAPARHGSPGVRARGGTRGPAGPPPEPRRSVIRGLLRTGVSHNLGRIRDPAAAVEPSGSPVLLSSGRDRRGRSSPRGT